MGRYREVVLVKTMGGPVDKGCVKGGRGVDVHKHTQGVVYGNQSMLWYWASGVRCYC